LKRYSRCHILLFVFFEFGNLSDLLFSTRALLFMENKDYCRLTSRLISSQYVRAIVWASYIQAHKLYKRRYFVKAFTVCASLLCNTLSHNSTLSDYFENGIVCHFLYRKREYSDKSLPLLASDLLRCAV